MATHSQKKVNRYLLTRGQKDSYTENIIWYELITKSMNPNIIIRDYEDGDEQGIVNLMSITYENMKLWKGTAYWLWKFKYNPTGFSHGNVVVAEHEGEIIATYSFNQMRIKFQDGIVKGAQAVDLATHRKYRRQGLFRRMSERLYSNAVEKGIELGISFPASYGREINEYKGASLKGHLKFGWFEVGSMVPYVKILDIGAVLKARYKSRLAPALLKVPGNIALRMRSRVKNPPSVKGLKIEERARFNKDFDSLWEKAYGDWNICVVRSREHLNWRYLGAPHAKYFILSAEVHGELLGYAVLCLKGISEAKAGYIIDIFALRSRRDVVHNLIHRSIEVFKGQKASKIVCWALAAHPYSSILADCGFLKRSPNKKLVARVGGQLVTEKSYVENPGNWFATIGDSDTM